MADIYFNCVRCSQHLVIDAAGTGVLITCPTCGMPLMVPAPMAESPPKQTQRILPFENPKAYSSAMTQHHGEYPKTKAA